MVLKTEIINSLRDIVGSENILTDVEDLYVYSFERIYKERCIQKLDAVVITKDEREIDNVSKLARKQDFTLIKQGKTLANSGLRPAVLLHYSNQPPLTFFEESSPELTKKNTNEFRVTEIGTKKKLALAQKLMFLEKPTIKCEECNVCSSYCTVASSFNGIETWSSKGRMLIIKGILKKELSITQKVIDVIYTCSNCGLCFSECLNHSELQKAIRAARHQIRLMGFTPQVLEATAKNILKTGDPSGVAPRKRFSWLKQVSNKPMRFGERADILYWVGCTVGTRTPNAAKAVLNILNLAEVDVALLNEDEGCCGYFLLATGLWDEARKNALKLIEKLDRIGANTMVTSCAGCYYTFSKLFPEILDIEMPLNILHITELIKNLINEGRIELKNVDARATFHDPCSLGRHANVYYPPRSVLNRIPSLQFIEMTLNKNRARCCGGGGGLWSYNNKVSMHSALNRLVLDVTPLDVDLLITACPICYMNLRYASIRNSVPVKICDFAEIVEEAMFSDLKI